MERKIEKRQLANILALFLIVQFGGLLFALYTIPPNEISALVAQTTQSAQPATSAIFILYVVFAIAIAAIVLIFLFRTYKGSLMFRLLEAYAIGLPTFFIGLYLTGDIFPNATIVQAVAAGIIIAAALVLAKNKWPKLRNFATVVASMGIGVVIGFNGFAIAYLLLMIIAVYDYIAVFVTKHMQVMARAMAERNLAFLIGSSDVEMTPGSMLSDDDRREINQALKKNKPKDPTIRRMIDEGAYPSVSQVALGGGDLALPLMLVVGTYISFSSIFIPVMIVLGSCIGLIATMSLLDKYKVPLPAIPPLFAFMNLALAVALFVTGKATIGVSLIFVAISLITLEIILLTLRRNKQKDLQNPKGPTRS